MILFSFQFFLTNIIFSIVICVSLIRLNKEKIHSNLELLLYSLGLGPIFTSLLLYYLLLFFPYRSNFFYLLAVIIIYLALALLGRKCFLVLWKDLVLRIENTKKTFKKLNTYHRVEFIVFSLIIMLFLTSFLSFYLTNTLQTPLDGTDALKYGTLGKILFKEKSLEYRWIRTYPKTGFYSTINQAPSFSLLLTWEKIMDSFFKVDKDLYYKSISAYYALLILSVLVFWVSKKSKYLALLSVLALLSGMSFFNKLTQQHLDSYRVFVLIISWIYLAYAIEKKDVLSFFLFGIFSGFAAFAHTIGAVLVVFNFLTIFFLIKGRMNYRLSRASFIVMLVIIFGWIHYILDIFWGFGWIIFDRQVTWWG